jgi:hypothetical protein
MTILSPDSLTGRIEKDPASCVLPEGARYTAHEWNSGCIYRFPAGTLAQSGWISFDMILDGNHLTVFRMKFQEGEKGPAFWMDFGLLCQCQARVRIPLEASTQNRWLYGKEGAVLKLDRKSVV